MGKIHMFQAKNWNFGPFRSKMGPGGQLGRKKFSSKDAPEPIVSFAEIKKHVTWAKVACSGHKMEFWTFSVQNGTRGSI